MSAVLESDSEYHIESGVPLPTRITEKRGLKYPLDKMQVGDSFAVRTQRERNLVMMAANGFRLRHKSSVRFISRKLAEDCYRIWRIA